MSRLLRIDASPRGEASHSRRFADEAVAHLAAVHGVVEVVRRDLTEPAGLIDAAYVRAMLGYPARRMPGEAALAESEALIRELETTALLLIASPVHNYTVPASLKAWVDKVVRIGRSFEGTPSGKRGLLRDRPTLVVAAAGGRFSGAAAQPDFFTPYLDAVLATIGIRSVRHIRLEGLARGEAAIADTQAAARAALVELRW